MCQARTSLNFSSVLAWTILACLTFGFCSIWSLHFVAMLACELDLPIGISAPLTVLSSVLAVLFTFAALASDLLWDRYNRQRRGKHWRSRRRPLRSASFNRPSRFAHESSSKARLDPLAQDDEESSDFADEPETPLSSDELLLEMDEHESISPRIRTEPSLFVKLVPSDGSVPRHSALPLYDEPVERTTKLQVPGIEPQSQSQPPQDTEASNPTDFRDCLRRRSSEASTSGRSSSFISSTASSYGLSNIMNIAYSTTSPAKNAFIATAEALHSGSTRLNILKGFLWSLAITSMHYVGIAALRIPNGYSTANFFLVILSGLISWVVCLVGIILMSQMETHLTRQLLFSAVATSGVAAMHFTGKLIVLFFSNLVE